MKTFLISFFSLSLLGSSLILISCEQKKEKAEQKLETSGYSATPADFLRAAQNGDLRALELFVQQEMDLEVRDKNGWSALHLAAIANRQESVDFLLSSGIEIDTPGLDQVTPLMLAARDGKTTMVRYLLKQGAKAELRDNKKRTALILAVEGAHASCIEELAPFSRNQLDTALLYAASRGKHEVIETLHSFGASVYVRHDGGMTPLMLAAHHGHSDTVHALIDSGSNRYAVNEHGWTAAQVASAQDHEILAAMLNQDPDDAEMSIVALDDSDEVEWESVVSNDNPKSASIADTSELPLVDDRTVSEPLIDRPDRRDKKEPESSANIVRGVDPVRMRRLPFVAGQTIAVNPQNPAKITEHIAMVDYRENPLPLIVESVKSSFPGASRKAEFRQLYGQQKKMEVREGELIPETRFKVVSILPLRNHSKVTNGQPADISVVEIEDLRTGARRKMITHITASSSDPWAVMRTRGDGKYYAVRSGQSFTSDNGEEFTVTDVRPNQLVITHVASGEVSTVALGR